MAMCVIAVVGAVPVLFTRRKPDHVTGANLFDWTSPALRSPAAERHDQGLAQRVSVPRGPSAGLERDTGRSRACGSVGLEQGIDADRARKPVSRPFARRLRAAAFD